MNKANFLLLLGVLFSIAGLVLWNRDTYVMDNGDLAIPLLAFIFLLVGVGTLLYRAYVLIKERKPW